MSPVSNLLEVAKSKSPRARAEAIKRLGTFKDQELFEFYLKIAQNDESSVVRREAVSALGRLKNEKSIPILVKILDDDDPKVAAQALRALLVFQYHKEVWDLIYKMRFHENEMIRESIERLINRQKIFKKDEHPISPDNLKNLVIKGDVEEIIKLIPDESMHLTFTSPPYYNARDYSLYKSYEDYLDFLARVFEQVHRVTKEGRFFILNTSPIIVPRISRQHASKRYPIPYDIHGRLVNNGWEFIDDIVWVKPESSVKNRVGGFFQHRKPLGYKPNTVTEMVMVYRKKTTKLLDWNIRSYPYKTVQRSKVNGEIDTTNVWKIDPKYDAKHSAVFPQKLCEKIIKYYSYVGDLVFDPFAGSGTFGVMAALMERNFFLTEIDKQYFEVIKERINKVTSSILFNSIEPRYIDTKQFVCEMTNL